MPRLPTPGVGPLHGEAGLASSASLPAGRRTAGIHFISSNLEFRVKVLPAVFCRSPTHTLTLAISVSSQVTPKVCQFTLLLPSSQSSRPRTLPSPLHCPAPVPQRLLPGVRPCLAVSVTTSHMYLSPPCNVLEGVAKGLLTLLCPPSTHQCLRR